MNEEFFIEPEPLKNENSITVCFSSDDKYAPYLCVAICSVKENSDGDFYDICILDDDISQENKRKILSLADENFSIRFVDIKSYIANYGRDVFVTNSHFTEAAYFRLFIPEIFKKYSKVVYLDCDICVCRNLRYLFDIDLNEKSIGAVLDTEIRREIFIDNSDTKEYLINTLGMKFPEKYFQSGVLLLDIKKLRSFDFTNKCMRRLKEIGNPRYVDQCVLNSIFDGNVFFLDNKWNLEWHIPFFVENLSTQLPSEIYQMYQCAYDNPYVAHYCSGIKPWINKEVCLADIWWKYARQTPFYEDFLSDLWEKAIEDRLFCRWGYWKYRLYYLLSKLTLGKMRKRYKMKRKEIRAKITQVKKFQKGK